MPPRIGHGSATSGNDACAHARTPPRWEDGCVTCDRAECRPLCLTCYRRWCPLREHACHLRRDPARRVRRAGGPGGCDPVPQERDARSGNPRRKARGGRAPLSPLRRGEPDQRPEPRPQGGAGEGPHRARDHAPRLLGQPQLGPVPRRGRDRGLGQRSQHPPRLRHQRLQLVLQLPPVSRGLRPRPGGDRPGRDGDDRQDPPVLRSPRLRRGFRDRRA